MILMLGSAGACAWAGPRRVRQVDRPRMPLDFVGDRGYAKAVLARLD